MTVPVRPSSFPSPRPPGGSRPPADRAGGPVARHRPARPAAAAPAPAEALWDPWSSATDADPERARIPLRDGTVVRLRSLRRDDREALLEWFDGLSPQSRRLRFFGPKPVLAPFEIDRFLDVDGRRQHAIVATEEPAEGAGERGRVAGIVRFVRDADDPKQAEIAIAVVDAFQTKGLGRVLLERILEAAQCRGIERVIGEALHENRRVGELVKRVAPQSRQRSLGITRQHVIDLDRRPSHG